MNSNLYGRWFRSESITPSLGTTSPVKLDFLAQARHMTAPEVSDIVFRITGTVGAVTGGALGRDAAKLLDTIRFTDEEEVVNASGAMLRVQEQMEFGAKQVEPADISSGSTNSSYDYKLRITFAPYKANRPRDTMIPLEHFLEGGELLFGFASALPTGWNTLQSDVRVRAMVRVVDGRAKELKSRLTYREVAMTNQEFDYEVNGSLRSAIIGSKLATTGYSSMASYTTIFSRTLDLPPTFETAMLVSNYRRESEGVLGTNDEFALATPGAIPLVAPDKHQKIGKMIDTKTLHIDMLAATATSQRLLVSAIKNRTPNMSALVAGYTSVEDLQMAMANAGRVVDDQTGGTRVTQYAPTLVRRLPVRIRRDKH